MAQEGSTEATETKRKAVGKVRVKPRHLSQIMQRAIVEEFGAVQSTEDVAESLGLPVRTVTDVLLLSLRKPVTSERALYPVVMRRTA